MEEKDTTASKPNNKLVIILALVAVVLLILVGVLYVLHKSDEAKKAALASKTSYESVINQTATLLDAGEVYSITPAPSLDGKARGFGEKAYKVQTERCDEIIFYIKNNKVILATYNKKDFYKNAKVLGKISDVTLTVNEMTDYEQMTQDIVGNLLASSGSLKYPLLNEWKMTRNEPKVEVSSYVDSVSSSGKTKRHTFTIKFVNKSAKSVVLDGKNYTN